MGQERVEVQVNVCAPADRIIPALSLTRGDTLTVWYFDDDALSLYDGRLVFRLRLGSKERQLTLKARVDSCDAVDASLIPAGQGKCEYDAHGDDVTAAVSLDSKLDESTVRRLLDGTASLASVLTPAQVRFLESRPGAWPLPERVRPLGPASLTSYRPAAGRYVADVWEVGGRTYVEVSQKTPPAGAPTVHEEILSTLKQAGLAPCEDQSTRAGEKLQVLRGAPPTRVP